MNAAPSLAPCFDFDATFPFHNGPDVTAVFCQFRKNSFKNQFVHLQGERYRPARFLQSPYPPKEAPFFPLGLNSESLRERLFEFMVVVDVSNVVELLKYKMTGVI